MPLIAIVINPSTPIRIGKHHQMKNNKVIRIVFALSLSVIYSFYRVSSRANFIFSVWAWVWTRSARILLTKNDYYINTSMIEIGKSSNLILHNMLHEKELVVRWNGNQNQKKQQQWKKNTRLQQYEMVMCSFLFWILYCILYICISIYVWFSANDIECECFT